MKDLSKNRFIPRRIRKILELANRFPRIAKAIFHYLLIDFAFELIGLAWDGLRARAAVAVFPVALGSEEAEGLMFIDWANANKDAIEGLPRSYVVDSYVAHRESWQPGSKEAKALESYEKSFKRYFM